VWQVGLDIAGARLARAAALLTPAELARAERGTSTVRRRRIALRAALRTVIGQALGCAPVDVPLGTGAHGRPCLDLAAPEWDINCAGSEALGLIVVARGVRVGIDVEHITPWTEAAAQEGWLSPPELSALQSLPSAERDVAAARCWTQKEAVLKAIGSGLLLPAVAVATSPGRPGGRSGGWTVSPVTVPTGFVASLACSTPVRTCGPAVVPQLMPDPTSTRGHHHDDARHI
jgi:4'-phosphopantetheinyl transferase